MKGSELKQRQVGSTVRTLRVCVAFLLSAAMALSFGAVPASAQTVVKTVRVGDFPLAIGVNFKTGKKYVVNGVDDSVSVLDADDTVIKTFAVGCCPNGVALNEKLNRIYVTNRVDGTVSVIDGNADGVVKTVGVGERPEGVAANPSSHKVYVANSTDDTLSVINGMTDTVSKTIAVGDNPWGVAVNPRTNRVYAANYDGKSISVIDGKSDSVVETVALPGASNVCVNPETNLVYAAGTAAERDEGMVWVIDGETNAVRSAIEVSYSPVINMAVNPATNRIYACSSEENELSIINGASGVLRTTVGVGDSPMGAGVDPRTDKVYVANCGDDTVSIVHDPPGDAFYFAEGTTRPGFDPYICVQNTGEDEAEVTVTYMPGQGDPKEQQLKIPPRSRATVHPADVLGTGDDPSHDFSAKVECTNGQRIVAERPTYFNYKGAWAGGHNVMGATGPNYEAYFAEATNRPGFEPYVCVQNPSYEGTGLQLLLGPDIHMRTSVAPRSRATVSYLEMEEAGPDFGIRVVSDSLPGGRWQKIIAERPMYFNYNGLWAGGSDVVGTPSPGQTFYFAEGTTRPGFDSYICLWAPRYAAQVRITYMLGDGTTKEQEFEFGARTTINCRDVLGTGDDASHDFSARVESLNGQPIVAERPMYFNYHGAWAGGHDVIGASSPSRAFYFAEGCARPGFHTYFCIQNPEDQAAEVKITYMKGDGTTSEQNLQVKSHSRSTVACHDFLGTSDDTSHDFSARVECTNGQRIVAERPTYFNYRGVWAGGHNVMGYQE